LSFACSALAGTSLFVAPDGNDSNPGTRAKPFATFEAARDAIRAFKSKGALPRGGVIVWIRAGNYLRDRTFELSSQDSGTPKAPILYRAADHETVRILGGRFLHNFHPLTNQSVLARLDTGARGHVWEADLRAAGITEFGPLRSRGFGRPIVAAHSELFFGGQPMTLARWPNEGQWERIAGFPDSAGQGDEHGGKIGSLTGGFYYGGDRPNRWQSTDDLWVHGFWAWDWANSYEHVESLDRAHHLVHTASPYGLYGFRKEQRFYFLNILEELDQPGEWYLDRGAGRLYFWPPSTNTAGQFAPAARQAPGNLNSQTAFAGSALQGEVLLSLLEGPLISLHDASYVTFRGLDFEGTRGHGVLIRGGTNDLIAGCGLRLLGNYGVWIEGGHGHGVQACDIENTGDGGVYLSGGNRQTLSPGAHFVENCRFQKQGRWSKCYVPAVMIEGVGQRVAHNLIHDHPHCAILFSGNEHHIEFNEIHRVALETGDVGAIYAGRDWTFQGNVIRYNFIHHTGGVGMGSMGVYMDDCVSGTTIYGNIFFKVSRAAFLGGGRDHRVENNIFVDCDPAVQLDGRGLDHSPVWHDMVYDFMKRQLASVPFELYRSRYPALTNVDHFYQSTTNGIPPEGNVVVHNICVGGKWLSVGWHAQPSMLDLHDNYVGPDPGFQALQDLNFRLKKGSVPLKIGFKAIPMEQIGPQKDAFRPQ
jgi:hypothetical protein